ncbi:peptidase M23-like protein [Arthrobacter sp. SLBN-83]|uniref:peptidoglycan DD-metalloendopeptidase family protein n=1 Tax=Arthrobacter sp. SLBN-83 TaxID=2768449 RepID=UPI00114EED3F|nr:peptidoglycan DD-metalloendopeptidase family protein [Arthrobacter sp. SLBN-83]TQJ60478.1 peptidase M23-like protein [Arthrobacter sp. SLBN-83]
MALSLGELSGIISLNEKPALLSLGRVRKGMQDTASEGQRSTDKMQAQVKKYETAVENASANVAKSKRREEDASAKVRAAEEALTKARQKGADGTETVAKAQERLAAAHRRAQDAQDATARSTRDLEAAQERLANLTSRNTNRISLDFHKMSENISKEGTRGGRAFTQAFVGVVGGLSAITPAAGAAGASIVAAAGNAVTFAASLSSLAGVAALVPAGLMSIGAGAGTLLAAFSGVGEALKTATEAANAISTTNPRIAAMAVEDAMMAITIAEENAAEAQENAARRVSDAKRALQEVTISVAEDQKAAAKAVEMAERDEAKAARDVIEAQKDLTKAREDAAKKVSSVGRELEAANLKAVDTALAYKDATDAYNKALADPKASDDQLARLENNMAKAGLADENAKRSVLDLRDEQDKAQKEQTAANEKVLDAEQKLTDARQAQADAIQNRKDAQENVLKQERDGAQRIADAQQAVADATKAAEKAQVDSARAVEQAHRNLERVQMQQADTAAQAGAKSAQAMDNLTPSAQQAVRSLLVVKDQLDGIRKIAQENFFSGFSAPLLSLAHTVMPQLATGVAAIASAMGSGAQIFMRALEGALGGGVLESLLLGVAKSTEILNTAITPIVQAFTTLGVVGMQYMPLLAQWVADVATQFNDFIQAAAADGRLKGWIDAGIQALQDLWSIAGSVVGIFQSINKAAEAGGAVSTLAGLAEGLRNVSAAMQGEEFQRTLSTIFSGAAQGAQGLLAALGPIGAAFSAGAPALAEFLKLGGEIAGTFIGGVFTALSNPDFGNGLISFMSGLQQGVAAIAPLLPGLTGAFGKLLEALGPIAAQVGPSLVQVFTFFAGSIANVLSFLDPLLSAVAGSPVVLGLLIGAFTATAAASAALTAAGNVQRIAMTAWSAGAKAVAAAQWLLNAAMNANPMAKVIGLVSLVVGALVWFFTQTELGQQIVQNVWAGIQVAVGAVADWFTNTAVPALQGAFNAVADACNWLYQNVFKPVFDGIGSVITWLWTEVLKPTIDTWVYMFENILGPAFTWLYEKVIKPAFDGIGGVIKWVWEEVIKKTIDTWVYMFENILGPAFSWLYEKIIKPAFDGIGGAIKWVWENVIKPVFDTLSDFITKTIPKAFEDGVGFVKTAWEKLQDIAKAPVRFVVDTVINDGLIGAFNTVAGVLPGVPKLDRVKLPEGFSRGGVLPGYEPQKRDTVLTPMRPGEGVLVPEVVKGAGRGFIDTLNAAGNRGVGAVKALMAQGFHPGRALGGLINPLPSSVVSQPFSSTHNGMDFAAPTGTPVRAAGGGRVSMAGWSTGGGGNEIHIDHPNGLQTWYAHLSSFAVKAGQMVNTGTRIGEVGSTGNSTGPHLHYMVLNGGWPNYMNPAPYLSGGGDIPAGGTPWNPITGIIDGLLGKFKEAFPGSGVFLDIVGGIGKKVLTDVSNFITGAFGGHKDDTGNVLAPTLYDGGGWLENTGGPQIVQHNKSKPDAVLTYEELQMFKAAALNGTGGGIQYSPTYQYIGEDPQTVMRRDKARAMDLFNALTPVG